MKPGAPRSSPYAPPLAYAGEHDRLENERAEIIAKLKRNGPHSIYRPALQRRLIIITGRLLAIGEPAAPVPGQDRKDFQ